jgi:hypothetical protein
VGISFFKIGQERLGIFNYLPAAPKTWNKALGGTCMSIFFEASYTQSVKKYYLL